MMADKLSKMAVVVQGETQLSVKESLVRRGRAQEGFWRLGWTEEGRQDGEGWKGQGQWANGD